MATAKKLDTAKSTLKKHDLIVVTGAGGFIGGNLIKYFQDQGFTNLRAVDKKPLPRWYPRGQTGLSRCAWT